MRNLRLFLLILRRSDAGKVLAGFLLVYLACALVICAVEPNVATYRDALWFLWAVSTTVGLGDLTAVTVAGRAVAIVCSIYAIVTTAIITGVIVDYFNEVRQRQLDGSMAEFLDKLERLPELDEQELARLSGQVKRMRKSR